MLALDDLGGLLYAERFPTVSEIAKRIKAFRDFRGDSKEWDSLYLEASSFSNKSFLHTKEWDNIGKAQRLNESFWKRHFVNRFKKYKEQDKKDQTLAMYLLIQFWLGWDKETLERAYYTYTDSNTRQLLVWFMRQEMQKAQHFPFINKHQAAQDCGDVVCDKLRDILHGVAPH